MRDACSSFGDLQGDNNRNDSQLTSRPESRRRKAIAVRCTWSHTEDWDRRVLLRVRGSEICLFNVLGSRCSILSFLAQYTSNLYGNMSPICIAVLSWLLGIENRETPQYTSHLHCSTPSICTMNMPPILYHQYF